MKSNLIVLSLFICTSCITFDDGEENVMFSLKNIGQTHYSKITVYAKELSPSTSYLDSTEALMELNSPVNRPSDTSYAVTVDLGKIKNAKQGLFEIKAVNVNSEMISKEFGSINGVKTQEFFWIELKDSAIFVYNKRQ
ncbi:hypothetical protein [Dyadobacter sp. CY323]|uniref:hypothetical protein n=1 Tax=Dyadobacter sp. CY323 TaxID=2907302 RepID=UPI001F3567E4|nr:hypothetical protein [Dyadobacter sp. CY323]MCE6992369.1 hypothetical protein [Dyadobacter sp. CY323]